MMRENKERTNYHVLSTTRGIVHLQAVLTAMVLCQPEKEASFYLFH
jgi:hypothetical protein